jgi:hypothetical protein
MSTPLRESRSGSSSKPSSTTLATLRQKPPMVSDVDEDRIRTVLSHYLINMRKDHAYMVKNALAAAKIESDRRSEFLGNGQGGRPGILYDEESPFNHMKNIAKKRQEEIPKNTNFVKFSVARYGSSQRHDLFVPTVPIEVSPDTPAPRKCRAYTTLRNNVIGKNEEEMRYLPYFGETAEEDVLSKLGLENWFIDKTSEIKQDGRIKECRLSCYIWKPNLRLLIKNQKKKNQTPWSIEASLTIS